MTAEGLQSRKPASLRTQRGAWHTTDNVAPWMIATTIAAPWQARHVLQLFLALLYERRVLLLSHSVEVLGRCAMVWTHSRASRRDSVTQ